jgi:cobalamin-dependent methionine synthase I
MISLWATEAKKLFDDAQVLLKKIVDKKLLHANGVIGFWPANSVGDDIEIYTDDTRTTLLTRIHTLRQQAKRLKTSRIMHCRILSPRKKAVCPIIGAALP